MEEKHSKFNKKWYKVYINNRNSKRKQINIIKKFGPYVQVLWVYNNNKQKLDIYIRTKVYKEKTKNPYINKMPLVSWLTKSEIVKISNK